MSVVPIKVVIAVLLVFFLAGVGVWLLTPPVPQVGGEAGLPIIELHPYRLSLLERILFWLGW